MKLRHYTEVRPDPSGEAGAEGVTIRWVISDQDGAPNFSMRVITIEPGGHTPLHDHPWEHEVFVLSGSGTIVQEHGEQACASGDVIYIEPGQMHQFRNISAGSMEFICLIPTRD